MRNRIIVSRLITNRRNKNREPLVVLDFLSLLNGGSSADEIICGGRHRNQMEYYEAIFQELARDCELVFFCDLKLQTDKVPVWLKRRKEDAIQYANLFDALETGRSLTVLLPTLKDLKPVAAIFYSISMVARKYGKFRFCNEHECDLELARYASDNNALAIISNDTDFLIFPGAWRFWACDKPSRSLNATEFDRTGLARRLALSAEQRPLFATLMGNDFTSKYFNSELAQFFNQLGGWHQRFANVAAFVRQIQRNQLTRGDLQSLALRIFNDEQLFELLQDSIDSYRLDYAIVPLNPIVKQMVGNVIERFYLEVIADVQTINLPFCDMRGTPASANITRMFSDMLKRKIGVVRVHDKDRSFTFALLSRQSPDAYFERTTEQPIYPDCKNPLNNHYYCFRFCSLAARLTKIFVGVLGLFA